jgi:high-affinity Fe2+/Pb2+ permease
MTASRSPMRFLTILVCLIVTFGTCAAAAAAVGTVTKVQKQAQIGSTTAVVGTPVNMNDEIRTGPGARLQITFRDETLLTLGENARVVVDRYTYNPGTSTGVLSLNAAQGALRFATGKLSKMSNKDVTVTTPSAALAVRGTVFWAGFVDLQYGVLLLSKTGKVDVSNAGETATLSQAGYGVDIPPSLKDDFGPGDPTKWSDKKVAAALGQTSFVGLASAGSAAAAAAIAAAVAAAAIAAGRDDDDPVPVSP